MRATCKNRSVRRHLKAQRRCFCSLTRFQHRAPQIEALHPLVETPRSQGTAIHRTAPLPVLQRIQKASEPPRVQRVQPRVLELEPVPEVQQPHCPSGDRPHPSDQGTQGPREKPRPSSRPTALEAIPWIKDPWIRPQEHYHDNSVQI